MMQRRVLVLEDNVAQRQAICQLLQNLALELEVHCAGSYQEAMRLLTQFTMHLFILDIILDTTKPGDASGIRLAEAVRNIAKYKHTPIIFTTSVEDPKLYSYSKLHCFEYIEKPYHMETVRQTILEALQIPVVLDEDRYISFQKDRILYSKQIKEILYFEISRQEVHVYCVNDHFTIPYKSCKDMLEYLDCDLFIQCNRYTIVNKKHIDSVDYTNRYITIKNYTTRLEIGRIMRKQFEESMTIWFQRH